MGRGPLPNFDSSNPEEEFLPRALVREHDAIVAFYVSRFASPRDAISAQMADSAHVERRDTAGASDAEYSEAIAEAERLDAAAHYERNMLLDGVLADLEFGTDAEIRNARKKAQAGLEEFRERRGCLPSQVESALRHVLRDEQVERRASAGYPFTPTVTDLGPNADPLVHAWSWIELITIPVLIAHQSPDYFFNSYAPKRYGNFDPADPYLTVRAWGRMAIIFNADARRAWKELSDRARSSIQEDAPIRFGADGAPAKIRDHMQRADFYAREKDRQRRALKKPRPAATAAAEVATAAHFSIGRRSIGPHSIQRSIKITRRIRRLEADPINWLDFAL